VYAFAAPCRDNLETKEVCLAAGTTSVKTNANTRQLADQRHNNRTLTNWFMAS